MSDWHDEIEYIMEHFDFERVHAVMKLLNWTYSPSNKVPTLEEVKTAARKHLEAIGGDTIGERSGGFNARLERDEGFEFLRLSFEVEQCDSLYRPFKILLLADGHCRLGRFKRERNGESRAPSPAW